MLKSSRKLVTSIILFTSLFSVLEHTHAAPNPVYRTSSLRRQEVAFTGPTKVHTEHTTQTAQGPVTEICDITFTPVQNRQGQQFVREDRICVVTFTSTNNGGNNNGGNNNGGNNDGSTTTTTDSSSTTDTSSSTTTADSSTVTDANGSSSASNTQGGAGATLVSTGSIDGSSISATATSSGASSTASAETSGAGASIISTGTTSVAAGATATAGSTGSSLGDNNGSGASSTTDPNASASAAAASTTPTNFQLPGTKLSVLPIGLAVFAGVSVIALIVVGLVTYERTKYRRAFRQRRLAEQGGAPGMSERS